MYIYHLYRRVETWPHYTNLCFLYLFFHPCSYNNNIRTMHYCERIKCNRSDFASLYSVGTYNTAGEFAKRLYALSAAVPSLTHSISTECSTYLIILYRIATTSPIHHLPKESECNTIFLHNNNNNNMCIAVERHAQNFVNIIYYWVKCLFRR